MPQEENNNRAENAVNLSWEDAIIKVLEDDGPMHYGEIAENVIERKLRENFGATPAQTVNSIIAVSLKNQKEKSPFDRIGRGFYSLKQKGKTQDKGKPEEQEEESLIGAFGMYWSREDVHWKSQGTRLLGRQQDGAETVDFFDQRGVYILYDQNKLVYAGKATDRALGIRLSEHTTDRHKARWDRFSWFGLKSVTDSGDLGNLNDSKSLHITSLITHLEALLIEACEPVQNRQRGANFNDIEYNQVRDDRIMDPIIAGVKGMLDSYKR